MPKSDSARKPKLPKVWLTFLDGSIQPWNWHAKKPSNENGLVSRLYAPVQPPRRCVWKLQHNSVTNGYTACGWWMDRDSTLKFCARCGGRIVRRKS